MRTGIVQQALTPEAASALKQSLNLAKRRGHAQVTPLHVATTLLVSSKDTANLLRRACLHSHPLHCRALELCFNVALNRLPSIPPLSSNSLLPLNEPSLSNSLIAALKRAQAHQRRSSIELQQQQQQQQEQPLLAIKVELEQLIISILDDPSVSRVMREAGFSSTSVKANVEEFCSASVYGELYSYSQFLRTHFSRLPSESQEEDLKVVLEVMSRKQSNRRHNIVIVGDSVLKTEWLVAELMERVRKGQVSDDLKSSQFIKLQISHSHVKNMSRNEVDMMVFNLRRKTASLLVEGNVIIYVGDLMWVVDEEEFSNGCRALDHLVQEIGRLLCEMRSCNKVWLMGVASYQTHIKCQKRQPSLEAQWGLHAVVVPSAGLGLSLQAPSGMDSRLRKHFNIEEQDRLIFCETMNADNGSSSMPHWLHTHRPENYDKGALLGLKRKWSELCQANHPSMFGQNLAEKRYTCTSRHPWCSSSSPPCNQNSAKLLESAQELIGISSSSGNDSSECQARNESKLRFCESKDVRTTLALASPLFSDSATSENQREGLVANPQELCQRLQEDITWQSEIIPSMVESLLDSISSEKRCTCLLIRGTDHIGKRKLAKTISEILYGSTQSVIYINMKKTTGIAFPSAGTILETLKRDPKRVFLIEDVDQAHNDFLENLAKNIKKIGFECPAIFIFTTTPTSTNTNFNRDKVLQMKMKIEEPKIDEDQEYELWNKSKKIRQEKTTDLDLNISVVAEEDDSGLTQEVEDQGFGLSPEFLELIGLHFTFNAGSDWYERVIESFSMKLHRFFEDVQSDKGDNEWSFSVDKRVLEGLVEASDMVMERWFEEWLREVFKRSLLLFKKGGKVRLSIDRGKEGNAMEGGFEGSLLPSRIHVDLDE
ncbi:protein SMAX1-LIKE 4-like [Dioscorea cayenensis subsp. rotundata]|uniref:Protein SMAX1-LIKE 4-like n=1 Tax=Dioscorea cayennensis subsp. rotundata TaxID=55577 RepID=A0AB40CQ56_DIOCR|nr:protein SMAX1-LIKE 4-like [Dioscorea cayenensis subsp. rotundata]